MTSFKSFTSHLKASPEFIPERFSRWDLFTSRFSRFFLALLLLLLFLVVVGGIVVRFASFCIFQPRTRISFSSLRVLNCRSDPSRMALR